MKKILEMNVDDHGNNGVYSLIRSIIINKPEELKIDIGCIEPFENKNNIAELNQYGTNVYYLGYEGNKVKKQKIISRNLTALLEKNQYDIIHIHSDIAYKPYVYATAAKAAKCPRIIIHAHATDAEEPHRSIKRLMHFATRNRLKDLATDYVGCSELAFKWMFPNVDRKNAQIIYNGIDLQKFSFDEKEREEIRKQYHIAENTFVIGNIGRFSSPKNHLFLLKVFKEIHHECTNTVLMLVGDGDYRKEIEQYINDNHLSDCVILTGVQKNSYRFYQAMDLFLLPSKSEGFPIVAVEAQASGLPVIISDQVTREVLINQNVEYLPIKDESVASWKKEALKIISSLGVPAIEEREKGIDNLKKKHLDIKDTENNFVNLYLNNH